MKTSALLSLIFASLATSLPNPQAQGAGGCAAGVHIIVARASTEPKGPGVIGMVATQVVQALPGSNVESVDYPASLQNYAMSEGQGVAGMTKLIESYASKCPDGKMVLMGYSQGAQVVGDTMCGSTSQGLKPTPPISEASAKNIVAIIQMGDPTHILNQPQAVGTSMKQGLFPRKGTDSPTCKLLGTLAQSYCDSGDTFCDSGNSVAVHLNYVTKYGTQAKNFVVGKAGGGKTA